MRSALVHLCAISMVISGFHAAMTHYSSPGRVNTDAVAQHQIASVAGQSASQSLPSKHEAQPPVRKKARVVAVPITKPSAHVNTSDIYRAESPYSHAQRSFSDINTYSRTTLVNILCEPHSSGMNAISGSGVLIDSRGVILTNAHVAQYILIADSGKIDFSCFVRAGAPARALWKVEALYVPPVWISQHAADIRVEHPVGTGEHDYALVRITGSLDGSSLPVFPAQSLDVREGVAFTDDSVLIAGYPAEFIGGINTESNLFPVTSVTTVKEMLTFASSTIDVMSLGGVIQAQGGSSGGAVINAWNYLVGIVTTATEGKTTADRDLHALTLSYINRDLSTQSGTNLAGWLNGDIAAEASAFKTGVAPELEALLLAFVHDRQNPSRAAGN